MSDDKARRDNGPPISSSGMTLRDYFAAHIVSGLMQRFDNHPAPAAKLAEWSYEIATAMMNERER